MSSPGPLCSRNHSAEVLSVREGGAALPAPADLNERGGSWILFNCGSPSQLQNRFGGSRGIMEQPFQGGNGPCGLKGKCRMTKREAFLCWKPGNQVNLADRVGG